MATLIRSLHNTSAVNTLDLGIAGFDPTESLVIAPSTTVDLLTVMTADSLHAMQAQLQSLVTAGEASVAATIDSSALYPAGWAPSTVARYSLVGATGLTQLGTPITLFTPAVDGLYQINGYCVTTATGTAGDAAGQLLVGWNDETGLNQWYFAPNGIGTTATLISNGTTTVHAVAGQTIHYYVNSGTPVWTTMRVNIYFDVVQL